MDGYIPEEFTGPLVQATGNAIKGLIDHFRSRTTQSQRDALHFVVQSLVVEDRRLQQHGYSLKDVDVLVRMSLVDMKVQRMLSGNAIVNYIPTDLGIHVDRVNQEDVTP